MTREKKQKDYREKCILVGISHPKDDPELVRESLYELERLAQTSGARVVAMTEQQVRNIEPSTYIGSGKIEEIKGLIATHHAEAIIFDVDLSAAQNRRLEESLKCKVVDRSGLILDIFAQHATSKEGKLQVELAQYIYLLPRLKGQWGHFGKLGGGIGTRGPGETQLEVDRRRARERITRIRRALKEVEKSRDLHRKKREGIPVPTVAMVGYTNAGKSTLMNELTHAGVLVEDKLFATLDPKVKRVHLPSGRVVLFSDTVGFIRKLPHQLVEAFKATFEEVRAADLLLHVIDVSHPMAEQQREVVLSVLKELDLDQKPILEVYNKIDLLGPSAIEGKGIRVSAKKQIGIKKLLDAIEKRLSENFHTLRLKIPYEEVSELSWLYEVGQIRDRKDREDGVYLKIALSPANEKRLRQNKNIKVRKV